MSGLTPLTVLTGFLGSGKTTLLRHALRTPALAGTAVIVNEFGEIGLDHDLIESAEEDLVALSTGCLCCAVRGDLGRTIAGLLKRRTREEIAFERIVVETSGLADPAPIVQALALDRQIANRVQLARIVTTIDAVNGDAVARDFREAEKQLAFADSIVVTKTDLADASTARRTAECLNAQATIIEGRDGRADPAVLLPPMNSAVALSQWLNLASDQGAEHTAGIASVSLIREEPVPAVALTLFLEALAEACGPDLLRIKGLVQIAEAPETPAVVHGVQHVFHPLEWLDRWPGGDRRTRLVLIGRNLLAGWPRLLLQEIEREVAAAAD
jgi:G3E family GTPase